MSADEATPARPVVLVCASCQLPLEERDADAPPVGRSLHAAAVALAAARGLEVDFVAVECLAVCKRPVTVAFTAPGRWTYVAGDLTGPVAADNLVDAAALYAAAPDGLVPWRQRPVLLKKGVVARLPPWPIPASVSLPLAAAAPAKD